MVPAALASEIEAGTVVRISLRGRRVRGWVLDVGVEPETPVERLQPIARVSSAGPSPELLSLSEWAARRWAGPRTTFLRLATPPNNVPPSSTQAADSHGPDAFAPASDPDVERVAAEARTAKCAVVEWPPAVRMADLLRRLVASEGSTIVVVPDAERTAALAGHFERSGLMVAAFRGEDHDASRTSAWARARSGGVVVVGGRAAAWAPVPDLSAVIIVDDADEALKDERTPVWHARDLVRERAERAGARVTVVTPVATLEVRAWRPAVVGLTRARVRQGWGRVIAVDRREDPPGSGMFSPSVVDPMRRSAARGRVVCVLNRKGRARLLACGACRELVRCAACGSAVAEDDAGLVCPVCDETRPRLCAECGSTTLARIRPGIARLREEIEGLVPGVDVDEVEASSAAGSAAPILVGTEAVLHRVRDAVLVVFLDFDQELIAPRYRAGEQALWLLVRALRLVGGREGAGSVLVQTRAPGHDVLEAAVAAEPARWADRDAARREALSLPPFAALATAEGDGGVLDALVAAITADGGAQALGPVAIGGGRHRLLVKAPTNDALADVLAATLPGAREHGRVRVEVDPLRV